MASRNETTFQDDLWEHGKTYDADTGEFMTVYMRLKKIMGNNNPMIFDSPEYGRGTQKPDAAYFEQIEKWPYIDGSKEKFKKEDWL